VTQLRRMMLEELERRNYSAGTTLRYLRYVERFAEHFGKSPDKLSPDHLRTYQAYLLKVRKLGPGTVENHVAALRFLFIRTLGRHEFRQFLPYPKVRRKLPKILSQDEVARLIDASNSLFERTLLMVLYGTGMRRSDAPGLLAVAQAADLSVPFAHAPRRGAADHRQDRVARLQRSGQEGRYPEDSHAPPGSPQLGNASA
jgi:integrase/recombinase XerD